MAEQAFDRESAERVLRRAIELEDERRPHAVDGLTEEVLREAAEELGVDGSMVARAAAEERLGVLATTTRRADRIVGPAEVTVVRILDGDREQVLDRIDHGLRRVGFRRLRRGDAIAEYGRRRDPVATAQRAIRTVTGEESVSPLRHLRVTAEPVGAHHTVVAMVVDLSGQRSATLFAGALVGGGGATASIVEGLAFAPHWIALGAPVFVGIGGLILRGRTVSLREVETALEGLLDRFGRQMGEPGATRGQGRSRSTTAARSSSSWSS